MRATTFARSPVLPPLEETVVSTDARGGWPLVVRIWGDGKLVTAESSETQQLIDSITVTPTD